MDLVDRYLKAVAKALPEAQREDIIRELTEDIQSEMEDKQSELGRELTEAEQESLLKQRGNPLLLAASRLGLALHRNLAETRPALKSKGGPPLDLYNPSRRYLQGSGWPLAPPRALAGG